MSKRNLVWILVVIVIVLISIFSRGTSSTDTIKIGYFGPFTGPVAGDTGADIANGFKLALADRDTIAGKKVEIIFEDDGCDPKKAASAANKLINIDRVKILVSGVCSGSTLAAAPIAEQNKVILFTPVSTSPKITDAGDYVFRTSASSIKTAQAASGLLDTFGYRKIAVLFEAADYTVGWKDAFIKEFTAVPGNSIVTTESVVSTDTDLKTQLLKIAQSKPDAVMFVLNSTVTLNSAIKQMRDLKIDLPVIGNEYMGVRPIVENPLAEGMFASLYSYDSDAPKLVALLKRYKDTYGNLPSTEIYPALAYDGFNVLMDAIEACGGDDPECVKAALYKTAGYQGISGLITIDKNGDTERRFTLKEIKGGKLVDLK